MMMRDLFAAADLLALVGLRSLRCTSTRGMNSDPALCDRLILQLQLQGCFSEIA